MRVARWVRGEYYVEGIKVADDNDIIDVYERVGSEYRCFGSRAPGIEFWAQEGLFVFL